MHLYVFFPSLRARSGHGFRERQQRGLTGLPFGYQVAWLETVPTLYAYVCCCSLGEKGERVLYALWRVLHCLSPLMRLMPCTYFSLALLYACVLLAYLLGVSLSLALYIPSFLRIRYMHMGPGPPALVSYLKGVGR